MSNQDLAPTRALARFAAGLRYADLPPPVVEMARRLLVDWLGLTIAGSRQQLSPILARTVEGLGGNPQATVVGLGMRVSVAHAAMLNGTFAHSMDYDDVHQASGIHASAPVWAAALAVAEWRGSGAEEATAAYVAGYEVMGRIGLAVDAPMIRSNFHPTGTLGYFGAAAATARLLGLSEEATARALGIASGQTGGLTQVMGTMSKPFFGGHSAHGGVLSALMAWNGFQSATDAIEGKQGMLATFGTSRFTERMFRDLGRHWEFLDTSIKVYACCSLSHAMIDGLLEIREQEGVDPAGIEAIHVNMCPVGFRVLDRPVVNDGLAGKFSGYYIAAISMLDGGAIEAQFADERVKDPAVQSLMQRVRIVPAETLSETQAEVEVRLADGRSFRRRVDGVSGSPGKPLSWEGLAGKFERLARTSLPAERVARLLGLLEAWPATDVSELLRLTIA